MKATVTSIKERQPSRYGGYCTLITFKGDDGKSYSSWLATHCRNYSRWEPVIRSGVGSVVEHLLIKKDNLIDADSFPCVVSKPEEIILKREEIKKEKQLALF